MQTYLRLVDAYRAYGSHRGASNSLGCSRGFARTAHDEGWGESMPAIERVLRGEAVGGRALREHLAQQAELDQEVGPTAAARAKQPENYGKVIDAITGLEVEKVSAYASADGARTLALEGHVIRLQQGLLAKLQEGVSGLSAKVLEAVQDLSDRFDEVLASEKTTPNQVLNLVERYTRLCEQLVRTQGAVMSNERLHMGEPQEITETRQMEPERVVHVLRVAAKAHRRLGRDAEQAPEGAEEDEDDDDKHAEGAGA